jgi:4-hydroxy-tetrahydrodipicolinate synthase
VKKLRGTFVVMVTPFDENEAVDFNAIEQNIEWYLENKVHGIIPLGSTGEFSTLTEEERIKIAEFVIKKVNKRVPVCISTTANTTGKTIEYTKHAASIGADAVLILSPYYFNPLQDEILYHFETIADNVDIPIMVYNNPGTSGVDIELETVLKLAEKENIQYIKESTGDITRLREIERLSRGKITTFCGSEELVVESFFLGAQGWVSVIANAFPRKSAEIFEAAVLNNDYQRAKEVYYQILPICNELEQSGKLVQVIKYCMDKRGAIGGNYRSPKRPLDKEYLQKLDRLIEKI